MKIKVVSDLHLEFWYTELHNDEGCDVLVLAGDIFTAQEFYDYPVVSEYATDLGTRQRLALRFREFLSSASSLFKDVIYVPGNHEYYKSKWYAGTDYLRVECSRFSNVFMLEGESVVLGGIPFIGGALWTDMNKQDQLTLLSIKDQMNDFRLIRNDKRSFAALRPIDTVKRHKQTLVDFKAELDRYAGEPTVVVSHHAPSTLSIAEKYASDFTMNGGFASDLNDFILDHPQIKVWVHGHTHTSFDYMLGDDTRIVCNPKGYPLLGGPENPEFTLSKIIEL